MKSTLKKTKNSKQNKANTYNDNLVTVVALAKQINCYHAKAEANEAEALRNAWEAGTRLNMAFDQVAYGRWGKYLKEYCPNIGLTTVWRYRRFADSFSTVEELEGQSLTEIYQKLGLIKLEEERIPEDESKPSDPSANAKKKATKPNSPKKPLNPLTKVIKDVAKASAKFDAPASLSVAEKTAVRKLTITLEGVFGQIQTPSILGVDWQVKLDQPVANWTEEERRLFGADFAKLQPVYEKVEAIKQAQPAS